MRSTYAWHPEGSLAAVKHLAGNSTVADLVTTYDIWGNRASGTEVVNGTNTSSSYSYDSLNRLKTATINGSTETTAFDLYGNRSSKTAGGITTTYLHDAAQQLAEIQQNGVTAERLVYDDNGNLKKHCAGSASGNSADCTGSTVLSLAWNGLDQLIQANKTGQPVETYAYDDSGRRLKKTIGGTATHYAYDGPDLLAEYATPSGNPSAVYAHGAGIDEPLLRLTGSTHSPSATARYYAQDGLGSVIAAIGDIAEGGPVPASSVSTTHSYSEGSYPSAKLIDGETTGSGGFWAGSSANLATTPATATLELGSSKTVSRITLNRVLAYNTSYIVKDAEVQIRNPDNSWTTVGTLSGNTTVDSPEITLTNATGSAIKVLVKGVRSGNLVLLAEVSMQADGGAQSVATQRFDAWGKVVASSGNIPQFGYTGREPDATGLIFYRARYYHPQAGRFVSRDPLGFAAGINRYAYAGGNPILYNDPDGLAAQLAWNTGAQYWGQAQQTDYSTGFATIGATIAGVGVLPGSGATSGMTAGELLSGLRGGVLALPLLLSGDTRQDRTEVFVTYTRTNPISGQVYSGRTSGYADEPIDSILSRRSAGQPLLNGEGFNLPVVDKVSTDRAAIRGREQQLIDFNGGAKSVGGSSRNMINGVADFNLNRNYYINQSITEFGSLPDYSPSRIRFGTVTVP